MDVVISSASASTRICRGPGAGPRGAVGHPVLQNRMPVSDLELADATLAERTGFDPFSDCELRIPKDAGIVRYGRFRGNHGLAPLPPIAARLEVAPPRPLGRSFP